MDWMVANCYITLALLLWIAACFGYGGAIFSLYEKYLRFSSLHTPLPHSVPQSPAKYPKDTLIACGDNSSYIQRAYPHSQSESLRLNSSILASQPILKILTQLILGMLFLCLVVQILNFFLPISSLIASICLILSIALFIYHLKSFYIDTYLLTSAVLGFCTILPFSFLSDSVGDSVNYHIQILTWIQQSPVIFGLANIHGRLGFNGLIYNFYALTDVSLLFGKERSFIGNEIIYFGFFMSVFYILLKRHFNDITHLFIFCCGFAFPFIMIWGEFAGLYSEGIGAVLGILVFALLLHSIQAKETRILVLCFIIALFATMIKITNVALVLGTILISIFILKNTIFSKAYIKHYVLLCGLCIIFVLPWVLKGMMTSGMIAYPASVLYLESLPWAVSNTQRESEVCWIMSWAHAPGQNCAEVLSSYTWVWDWLGMKTRYFGWYFKHFVYVFGLSMALSLILFVLYKKIEPHIKTTLSLSGYIGIFCALLCGIIFWFVSGPDPRFGMVYIIPLLGFVYACNFYHIQHISKAYLRYIMLGLFIISILPMFFNQRPAIVLVWLILLLLPLRYARFYVPLAIIASLLCIPNMYRKSIYGIKELPKIRPIYVEEKQTHYGLTLFIRKDEPTAHTQSVLYEPLLTTPYFNAQIKETEILGRKAYMRGE
ncbi:hypothetical protein V3I05_03120 [Helicobacter mastomyrinus]|uniref:DUF8201 domain-containing protein n=2 Tax=Helicobacter TaxID=209 RepID=A0ABZ3F8H2_9HELI